MIAIVGNGYNRNGNDNTRNRSITLKKITHHQHHTPPLGSRVTFPSGIANFAKLHCRGEFLYPYSPD
ncbi:hypothetical protein CIB48_g10354 [Xylaria polymorpha]|nr:hypothetical protein CIB48_g10354 [Xylaria polymorpha]